MYKSSKTASFKTRLDQIQSIELGTTLARRLKQVLPV